jgi:hypothetical protein
MLCMPRFYFHVRDDGSLIIDTVGREYTSIAAARMRALELAAQIIIKELKDFGSVRQQHIEITDDDGQVLSVVPLLRG